MRRRIFGYIAAALMIAALGLPGVVQAHVPDKESIPLNQWGQCPGSPAPRLVIGQLGRVTPGPANALRDRPGKYDVGSVVIGYLAGGTVFTVLEGPACASGYAWWRVNANGRVGWTAEGEGWTYWLEPLGSVPPPPPPPVGCRIYPAVSGYINVRSGPGYNYWVIGYLQPGAQYLGETAGWYKIALSYGRTGWVTKSLTRRDCYGGPPPTVPPPPPPPTPISNCTLTALTQVPVYLRPDYVSLWGYLYQGQTVRAFARTANGWFGIEMNVYPLNVQIPQRLLWVSNAGIVPTLRESAGCATLPFINYPF